MRKAKIHYVTRGLLTGQGATKTEAKADLESWIDLACQHGAPHVESRFGLIIVVAASSVGWHHMVIDPAELTHGAVKHCSATYAKGTEFAKVEQYARMHAAQWAWSPDVDDAAFIAKAGLDSHGAGELGSWCAFQRAYAEFRAQGMSDSEAHQQACMAA